MKPPKRPRRGPEWSGAPAPGCPLSGGPCGAKLLGAVGVPHHEDALCCPTSPSPWAWPGVLSTQQSWVWRARGSMCGGRRAQPWLSPRPGGTRPAPRRHGRFHAPLSFEQIGKCTCFALIDPSLAPWGQTTPVQSPVPHVPSYRGHVRTPRVHAPSADVQHLGAHPEPGAGPGRLWGQKGRGEGGSARSASAPLVTSTHVLL